VAIGDFGTSALAAVGNGNGLDCGSTATSGSGSDSSNRKTGRRARGTRLDR
jgi:hypothetical protein